MIPPSPPPAVPPDDADDRIGAWLDGELPADDARAFAAEVDADAALAERVEAVRAVRERLAGADTVTVPGGFVDRVGHAVAAASVEPPASAPTTVADLGARRRARRRLAAIGSAAALLVAVAVAGPLVGDLGPAGDEAVTDADDAGEPADGGGGDIRPEAGQRGTDDDTAALEHREGEEQADGDRDLPGTTSAGAVPLVVDEPAGFDSPAALLAHLDDRPEAMELLDAPAGEVERLAARTADALAVAEPFRDGSPAGACVADVVAAHDGPVVFARVERVRLDGVPLTAHLIATGPRGDRLERVVATVRDPGDGCADHLTERLE